MFILHRSSFIIGVMGFASQIKVLFRLFLLFTVLVAVALISAITTIRLTIHGHQETMPNLVGRSGQSAQRLASGLGLDYIVEGKLYSSEHPADQVVSQEPPPGTRIKVGQHVHVLVSLGAPRAPIPDLVGATGRAAEITVVERGLTIGDVVSVHWPAGPARETADINVVVAQEPPPSTEAHSPAINFLISLGPPPAAYECPDFVGRPVQEAQRTIEAAGFKVGEVTQIWQGGTATVGTVLTQSPAPGSKIGLGAAFVFQVAAPPENPAPAAIAPTPQSR
jgi:eukaryotic-like serine/threonine-protein kinase